jgi:hypothetical protein
LAICLSNRYEILSDSEDLGGDPHTEHTAQEIETWVKALNFYDNNEFDESLGVFAEIADTSKIHFNCGVIHATLGEHERAVWRTAPIIVERKG